MILQFAALLAFVGFLIARERTMYNHRQRSLREQARQEREARTRLRPRTNDVTSSTVRPPATVHTLWPRLVEDPDDRPAA